MSSGLLNFVGDEVVDGDGFVAFSELRGVGVERHVRGGRVGLLAGSVVLSYWARCVFVWLVSMTRVCCGRWGLWAAVDVRLVG